MKNKKSVLSIILFLAILTSLLPLPVCAAITPASLSYTLGGEEYFFQSFENANVPFNAESVKIYFSSSISQGTAQLYYYIFEKEVMLPADVSISGNCVTVVPTERLEDGAKHKIVFENTQGSTTVSFNVTKSKNNLLFFYDDFEGETLKTVNQYNGAVIERTDVSGNNMLHMYVPSGVKTAGCADAVSSVAENESYVIVDAVINPVKIEGNAFVELFDSKNSVPLWRMGARLKSDGSIYLHNSSDVLEKVASWQAGVPFRYTAVYDLEEGKCSVYIDNIFKKSVTTKKLKTHTYRIDVYNRGGGDAEIYVDNLKIYSGKTFVSDEHFGIYDRYSAIDYSQIAQKAIGSAWVFTDAVYYYKDGKKHKYISEGQKPQIIDKKMYVTEDFVEEILCKSTASLQKENNLYDAEKLAALMGREYLFDERGFFILSEGEFPYINSPDFTTLFEESDYIYRYVNFDNPKSEEILQDLKNNIGKNMHPRICYTSDDITYIKNKTKTESIWLSMYNTLIANADFYITKEITLTSNCPDSNKQTQAAHFQMVMEYFSTAYLLTGNEDYAKKGMEYMDVMCGWESMGYTTSNLTMGHWAMGMALGYDAFYNYMMQTDEGKEKAMYYRKRVRELPFRDTIDAILLRRGREMSGGSYKNVHWMKLCDNFQGVVGGGLMALALSMADEQDMYEDSMYMLENLIRTMEIAISLYMTDGGYFEGVGYSEYMLSNLTKGITALFNTCGTDYGFGNAKGFTNAGEFFVYMQTLENRFNFSDCTREASTTMIPAFFAHYYGKTYYAKLTVEENKLRGENYDMLGWLHYYKAMERYGDVDTSNTETDRYYYAAEAGTFRKTFGTDKPTFAGFHGGTTNRAHDMLDTGEFVFEAGGVPWAIDLGRDDYGLPAYFGVNGYKIYRKHTQGENCVLINPLTDPDTYFGQTLGEEAPLIKYTSKPKGAFAAFDMTDVYQRDVTSYKRGYYFGDNRNTLTVQDEIILKDTSELYWFMHTPSNIEIVDSDTAKLSYGGEELLVEIYSNKPFTLSSMAAAPLAGTYDVEGQNKNEGISKVSIHFENVSGEVNIAVKLIHQSKYFTAEPLSFIPINDWSVDDGACDVKPVLTDIYVDPFKNMSASVQLPFDTKEAYIIVGSEEIFEINVPFGNVQKLTKIDVSALERGMYRAKMKVVYKDGHEQIIQSGFFGIEELESRVFYSNNLAREPEKTTMPAGWNLYQSYGTALQTDDCKTFKKGSDDCAIYTFRALDSKDALCGEVIVMECDISFSSLKGTFMIECQSTANWFFHNYKTLMGNGIMYDGSSYEADRWYRIKLEINTKKNLCSFYVDDKAMIENAYIPSAIDSYKYNLVFTPDSVDDAISYKNFKVWTTQDNENVSVSLLGYDKGINAIAEIKDTSLCEITHMKFAVCTYSDKQLKEINIHDVVLNDDSFNIEKTVPISEDVSEVKCFLLGGGNILVPIAKKVAKLNL